MSPTRITTIFATLLALALPAGVSDASKAAQLDTAIFAGGCFWCVEEAFEKVKGVTDVASGYTGGELPNPTYQQVGSNKTGHYEAVRVQYDPAQVTYAQLLDIFWHNVDPFDAEGQFCDKGSSYRAAIFATDGQRAAAEKSKAEVKGELKKDVVTEILPAAPFYPAEDYHQNYYETNALKYKYYKWACGRAQRLEEIWGKPKSS